MALEGSAVAISPTELKKHMAAEHSILVDENDPIITFLCAHDLLQTDRYNAYAEHIEKVMQQHADQTKDRGEITDLTKTIQKLLDEVRQSLSTTGTLQDDLKKDLKRKQKRERERIILLALITASNLVLIITLATLLL